MLARAWRGLKGRIKEEHEYKCGTAPMKGRRLTGAADGRPDPGDESLPHRAAEEARASLLDRPGATPDGFRVVEPQGD